MGKMSEKVIKPPIQKITSGKIFRPAKKYVYKEWVKQICIAFTLWLGIMVCFVGLTYFMGVYINSMEYSVKAESGETMPEIYVKKGIVTITRKHVPFRTITNIYSKAGPLDRLFGLGNVNIETAGFSGANQMGPEEKLEGVLFYEEVRDFILAELRNYREPYATGTEVSRSEERVPRGPGLDDEILITLREIRDLLKN